MWLLILLAMSFIGNEAFAQKKAPKKIPLGTITADPYNINVGSPGDLDLKLQWADGSGGSGSGQPSSLAVRCRTGFNSALETVAGFGLGVMAAKNQETWINRSFDYATDKLDFDFQKSERIMYSCDSNPQVCGVLASLDSNGSNYVAGMVAMQGSNNMMSPYNQSYGITGEAMQRNMMMQNPFMMPGYYNNNTDGNTNGGRGNSIS